MIETYSIVKIVVISNILIINISNVIVIFYASLKDAPLKAFGSSIFEKYYLINCYYYCSSYYA